MDRKEICSACNLKIDKDNYKKDKTICEIVTLECRKNNKNTSHHKQKSKVLITIIIEVSSDEIQPRSPGR